MAIGAIEMQGQILRTQDYSGMKHQQDLQADVVQSNIQQTRQTEAERRINRVNQSDQTSGQNNNQSASDKGGNEYTGDGGARRNEARAKAESDGKVLLKAVTHINTTV